MRSTSNSTTTKSKTVPLEHKEAEAESVSGSGSKKTLQCIWKPGDDDSCLHLVSEQIDASLLRTSAVPLEQHRWLFLGDSTMSRLFANYGLKRHFIDTAPIRKVCPQYSCNQISTGRCNTNEVFQLARRQDGQWSSPDYTRGEGPIKFGMENPYCQDCSGCDSALLTCANPQVTTESCFHGNNNTTTAATDRGIYGGYISVEFARDVEVQTDLFNTTQENLALYLEREWNSPSLVEDFGRPICVVSTGNHDVAIPNITKTAYLLNVQWYLHLLASQCDHLVWLANTSPKTDDFLQKKAQTQDWNLGVGDMLLRDDTLRSMSSFVDIFDASTTFPHEDNVHMHGSWYKQLAAIFLKIIQHESSGT